MKYAIAIAIICLFAVPAFTITIPPQCEGKIVECWSGVCTMTLMNCPIVETYDVNGKFAGWKETCRNQMKCNRSCSCDGFSFESYE